MYKNTRTCFKRKLKYMKLPVGIDDFKELIDGNYLLADKSLFIKDVIKDSAKVILLTRPRRFGKTLNLSMLYYFLRQNHDGGENLFKDLNISKDVEFCSKHQQQYPVIFITFKDIKQPTYDKSYARIEELIRKLYAEHRYLLEGDVLAQDEKNFFMDLLNKKAQESDIEAAIENLSAYIHRKFDKPPIILIDEYDTPIQEAYVKDYYQDMIDLMRSIFGRALKGNLSLKKAVITGITRISQESLFSGVNNLEVYSLLREDYGQYFGFTESEVSQLLTQTEANVTLASIKEWYNGYQVGKHVLYNPWSIISCLKNHGKLQPYWINTASNEPIAKLLKNTKASTKRQFEELLQGKTIERPISENLVFADIENREAALWSLLLYAGYLKVISSELHGFELIAELAIPNKEVGFVYDRIIAGWFDFVISRDSYMSFVRSLIKVDVHAFKRYLSDYIMQRGSYFDFNTNTAEQVFHVFILGLVVGLRDYYYIRSNQESGLGRFDVIFIPKKNQKRGILLELKTCATADLLSDKAQEALDQIKDKKYISTFKQNNVETVSAIGLAFCGKQLELIHEKINIT